MKDLGPVVPIVTPCNPDGSIDLLGFRSVCDEMLNAGCKGIFIAGTTGRGPWFGLQERTRMCNAAAEHIKSTTVNGGAAPLLFAGVTSSGLAGMLENAHAMADAGADVVVATVPTYFHYNYTEIETIYSKFADASPLPVMIYDIPEYTQVKLANDMVLRLARHGNVIGFKDSSADMERFKGLLDVLQTFPDFYLMQGKENLISESLQMGASGFIVSLLHIDPTPFVNVYRAVRQGDVKTAELNQDVINQVISLVRKCIDQRSESSTLFNMLNYALRKRGTCNSIMLDHDDTAPAWLLENTQRAIEICQSVKALS